MKLWRVFSALVLFSLAVCCMSSPPYAFADGGANGGQGGGAIWDGSACTVTDSRGLSWDIAAGYWKEGTPSAYFSDWQPLELTEVKTSESRLPKTDSDFFHRTFEVSGSGYKEGVRIDVFVAASRLSDDGCRLSYYVEYVDGTWDLLLDGYAGDTQAAIGSMYCFKLPKYITIAANSNYQGPTSIAAASVMVKSKTWTGKALKPAAPVVKLGGKTLRAGADYTWTCKGGKAVGSYTVTVTGKGAYAGTATAAFKILPKGTSVSKLSKAKRAFTVKWKSPSKAALKQVAGYQVRWSTSKKFTAKTTKTKTVKATSAAGKKRTLKVAKLKAKKTYYVQVRTYKKVGKVTYYSAWSKTVKVKTKK